MNAFDKVIGYKATKRELLQLCDMLRNREIYEEMGARLPHGLLLYGNPGLGKTLLARCFVEESGLHTITVRRDKGGDAFIDGIIQAFASAKTKAPSIVLLDDMDKFANEDDTHCDAPEYAAVQAGIDDVKDTGVFVIATANDIRKLPSSLRRSGRFDRKIGLQAPTASDAEEIIAHYLKSKKVSDSVNVEDLTRMMRYNSCAELETILNEAAVRAAFARKTGIDMEDMVSVVLKQQYGAQEDMPRVSDEVIEKVALHEAGHPPCFPPTKTGAAALSTAANTSPVHKAPSSPWAARPPWRCGMRGRLRRDAATISPVRSTVSARRQPRRVRWDSPC